MKNKYIHSTVFNGFALMGFLFVLFGFSFWDTSYPSDMSGKIPDEESFKYSDGKFGMDEKQRGAHVFRLVDSSDLQPLKDNNLEWITLVSWGYQEDFDSPIMTHHNGDSTYMHQHNYHWCNKIEKIREAGFKVFFKPHLWITSPSDGKWRSDIFPSSDENWELWKESYRNFIIRYATIAEQAGAEMFCIGIEFSKLTVEKPEFWRSLINEIRGIYSGKITYAANWYKEYEKITFWEDLDYIGVQAYFPLAKTEYPSVKQVSKGWKKYLRKMKSTYRKNNRKILFTEMGYKSTSNSAIRPWEWAEHSVSDNNIFSAETQANCYQAFFNTVWDQEWFAGVHIWQLRSDYKPRKERKDLNFTPQGKPAEGIIAKGFE